MAASSKKVVAPGALKQSSLSSFFGKPGAAPVKKAAAPTADSAPLAIVETPAAAPAADAADAEDASAPEASSPPLASTEPRQKRKRTLDDDDDDGDGAPAPEAKRAKVSETETPPSSIVLPLASADETMQSSGGAAAGAASEPMDVSTAAVWQSMFADGVEVPVPTALAAAEAYKASTYDPTGDAGWNAGEPVPFAALSAAFKRIEATPKRLETIALMCNFLRSVITLTPEDLLPCLYLCTNRVAPAFKGIELGIGDSIIQSAVAEATGGAAKNIKAKLETLGDLGLVAEASRSTQKMLIKPKALTVRRVFEIMTSIAEERGHSATERKRSRIKSMLVSCVNEEARYVVRLCQGKLRIGCSEASVVAALAHASFLSQPQGRVCIHTPSTARLMSPTALQAELDEATRVMKEVFCELPWLERVLEQLLAHGVRGLNERCFMVPGVPVKPMLAHPTKSVGEVLDRFDGSAFTCEYKYDGERAQVHLCPDGSIAVYSRNSENNTTKYPDIVAMLPSVVAEGQTPTSYVLDCEAVAYDRATGAILPFQVLSTRKKKDVAESDITVHVCLFAFDLLYLNGVSLLRSTLAERRALLHQTFTARDGYFMYATRRDTTDPDEMQAFLEEAMASNCEGLMVKTLEAGSTYEPSKRSHKWAKLKADYVAGLGDSVDLVVIGGYKGKGKRTGWYGGFLLACYEPETEVYQSICKIGTGFSDADLEAHTAFFADKIIDAPRSYYDFGESVRPDVWFDAVQVWEVLSADLSISPTHRAGAGLIDPSKGVSLRFPRFIRIRDDKAVEDATSAQQIADMYTRQGLNKQTAAPAAGDDDDDDF